MSSSISSSEAPRGRLRTGLRFAVAFVAASAAIFALLLATLAILDPYDTGRLTFLNRPGIAKQGPRTANASRGRDAAFDAAIIGNSHIQLIDPAVLGEAAGARFVSLIVPATYPREQFLVLDWFLRHHPAPKAVVIGLDDTWCRPDFHTDKPFPYWLYDPSALTYLSGLARYPALERLPGRIAILLGKGQRARADGYWNYDADYRAIGYGEQAYVDEKLKGARPVGPENGGPFVAAERLRVLLAGRPGPRAVVLAWPPVYIEAQPAPGSAAETAKANCKAAFARIAASDSRVAIVDWAVDRPETRDRALFFDRTHYRLELAAPFQRAIAEAIKP